jgi:hypothetical protein
VANLSEAVRDLLKKYTLQQYPYADSPWYSLEQELDREKHDYNIAVHFLKGFGLMDDDGRWLSDLIEYGLFTVADFLEADHATGFARKIKVTLVSDRGAGFLSEVLGLTIR